MGGDTASAVLAELDRLIPEGPAGVAVSGGGDSTALLVLSQRWAAARGRVIEAATVDHGLRPESAAEAQAAADLAARLGVPHRTLHTGDLRAAGGNLSAAAREARLAALGAWATGRGLPAVLLGHTLDDQAETVLMRLARGSGAEGLSGMASERLHAGLRWLRPLLGIRRADLRRLLESEGIAWIEDPTNEAPEYDRVKTRKALALLAPLGIEAEGLARTAWHLRRQRRVLERAMRQLADRARSWGPLGEARLDSPAMRADEPDTALRLLADTLMQVSGAAYRPRFRALSALLDQVLSGDDFTATLGGCLIASAPQGAVLICREPAACQPPVPLAEAGASGWDNRWRLDARGPWPRGAVAGALGETGLNRLGRLAAEGGPQLPEDWRNAPRHVRQTAPAVWSGAPADARVLLAVPAADYLNRQEIDSVCTIHAEKLTDGVLRCNQRPT
ncbi:MAG TPA: tRNA lysidine(34) synthetase TilS [Thermohalobaculum sp.]|nr:tRNA lysidine(34) synthetase TilS [Thermohalobaculum sp.]